LLDVDGTLVDTNYHHTLAWYRAFRQYGVTLPVWVIHRHIGMGGDQLVRALGGDRLEDELGDAIRKTETERYHELIGEVEPLPDAPRLVLELKGRGHVVVLASSAKANEVDHYIDLLQVRDVVDGWTTSADVEATKPEPDLVVTSLDKAGGGKATMLGDSTWDCLAARRAGVETVALLTGGYSEAELHAAGAKMVFESLGDLIERLDETPFTAS
jgi:phosphoglycolate phosphatase-like HAD superfamily hydrolase